MITYHKIDAVYERNSEGTRKLIEGKFCNPTVEFLADAEWVFTEKIDGTNIRIHWNGYRIEFGGRTECSQIPSYLYTKLTEIFLNNEMEGLFEQKFGTAEVILFGEGYGAKIQKIGEQYRPDVGFILFDVMINGNYQCRESIEDIADYFGLEIVPIILYGTLRDGVNYVKGNPKSKIGRAKMEGLVGRPKIELQDRCGKRVIVKIKACDFE